MVSFPELVGPKGLPNGTSVDIRAPEQVHEICVVEIQFVGFLERADTPGTSEQGARELRFAEELLQFGDIGCIDMAEQWQLELQNHHYCLFEALVIGFQTFEVIGVIPCLQIGRKILERLYL